jgi:hypothetical protein
MSDLCKHIESVLADEGAGALRHDEDAMRHAAECETCYALLEACAQLDEGLAGLPAIDAPEATVAALLARPELKQAAAEGGAPATVAVQKTRRRPTNRTLGLAAAASLLLAVALGVVDYRSGGPVADLVAGLESAPEKKDGRPLVLARVEQEGRTDTPSGPLDDENREFLHSLGYVGGGAEDKGESASPPPAVEKPRPRLKRKPSSDTALAEEERSRQLAEIQEFLEQAQEEPSTLVASADLEAVGDLSADKFSDESVEDLPVPSRFYQNVLTLAPGVQDSDGDGNANVHGSRNRDFKAQVGGVSNVDPLSGRQGSQINPNSIEEMEVITGGASVESDRVQGGFAETESDTAPADFDPAVAERFLAERSSVEGLSFVEASGYWANTYVPGDSELRLLQARLAAGDPSIVGAGPRALHAAVMRTAQPFDAPDRGALQVFLQSDRSGVEGRQRALIQVGLQATPGHGGRRPAMNVALVLDLPQDSDAGTAAALRALATALARSGEPGDRFRLYATGTPGREPDVGPAEFGYGRVGLVMDELLARRDGPADPSAGLVQRVKSAIEAVAGADDPDAPLGSSAVLVVTAAPLGPRSGALARLAHQSALAGIPVSVVGVGSGVVPEEIDRVALAGHGQRRLLAAAGDADELIERELAAASRAVARAVRLRIRLAPGVKLIDVPGSHRLDEAAAQRVRDGERMVDLRLARSLGIEADRGEDEQGVQVILPSFYAGDSHVILLDVVVPGPGPVADVVVRYKDLTRMRNGTVRAGLSLSDEPTEPGPLELNVLENLLARRLSETLRTAGRALAGGDREAAAALLEEQRQLLAGLRAAVPGLAGNSALANDVELLARYRKLISNRTVGDPSQLAYLSDSLRYAGWLRVLPPPSMR